MPGLPPLNQSRFGAFGGGGFYQEPQANRKLLGIGQITAATTWETVYTVKPGAQAEIRFCACYNTSGAVTQTVDIRVQMVNTSGTVNRQFARASVAPNGSVRFLEGGEALFLAPGQILQLYTTTANVLDYVISGIEWVIPTGNG